MVKAYKFGLGGDHSLDDEETRSLTDWTMRNADGDDKEDEGKVFRCVL